MFSTRSQNHRAESTSHLGAAAYGGCSCTNPQTGRDWMRFSASDTHEPFAVHAELVGVHEQRVEPVVGLGALGHAEKLDAGHAGESLCVPRVIRPASRR